MKLVWLFFWGLIFVFPFGQLIRLPFGIAGFPEIRVYLTDVFVFLIIVSWVLWKLVSKKRTFFPETSREFFSFVFFLFISWFVNLRNFPLEESLSGFLYLLRFFSYNCLFMLFFDLQKNNFKLKKNVIFFTFIFWGGLLGITGILQYWLLPDMRFLAPLGWDLHYYRAVGSFLDPNFFGLLLVLGILSGLMQLIPLDEEKKEKKNSKLAIIILPIMSASFLLTYSRGSYLAFLAAMAVILIIAKKVKFFFLLFLLFLFLICLLPRPGGEGVKLERISSVIQRAESWRKAILIWQKNPLFGVGFNNYRYAQRESGFLKETTWQESHAGAGADNSFLFILATGGILGLAGILIWFKAIISVAQKHSFADRIFFFSSLAAILTHSFFTNSFFYPWVMIWWGFLLTWLVLEVRN